MEITRIPFSAFPKLSKFDQAYSDRPHVFENFYKYPAHIDAFAQIMADKQQDKPDRVTLVSVLRKQYAAFATQNTEGGVFQKIDSLLAENTFTVTTAHQPSLLTGPLYFVYKIFSTIRLAESLKEAYPQQNFVPVFVIGGEDHDFEEVNHAFVFGKKLVWNRSDTAHRTPFGREGGAVGMMQTNSLRAVLDELKPILGASENAQTIFELIEKAYTEHPIYHDATQALLHSLFGRYGLVVLNMNDADLKRLFIPIMAKEIKEQASKQLVGETQAALEQMGFKPQAYAREINLFYLRENLRERIVEENGQYRVLNTDYAWNSLSAILKEVEETPQYFSPNVVLRPLYQELILPNLAYIGGGGELAYWLERKTQFAYFGLNFPMLIRRNSVLWLDKSSQDKLTKLGVQLIDLVHDTEVLVKKYIAQQAEDPLSMEAEKNALSAVLDAVVAKAKAIDPTLEKTVLAEKAKQIQSLEAIEGRILKAEKQKHETSLNQVKALQQKLFPNGGLQERTDNFLPLYVKHGVAFFDTLYAHLNPLEKGMFVISE
jgi:bacillithiol biosynthesis cysteine-adding enzyme BshC